mgnify:CR=1 FL=1
MEQAFNGHVHAYAYRKYLGRDYSQLVTTGGEQFLDFGPLMDLITLVTVDGNGVDIENLKLSGILDKAGTTPLGGDEVCFEKAVCRE